MSVNIPSRDTVAENFPKGLFCKAKTSGEAGGDLSTAVAVRLSVDMYTLIPCKHMQVHEQIQVQVKVQVQV